MTKLNRLKKEALESAKFRGHEMLRFQTENSHVATSNCINCGKWLTVNSQPGPNQIEIGGQTVAVSCK